MPVLEIRPHRLAWSRTPPSQGGYPGSNPGEVTDDTSTCPAAGFCAFVTGGGMFRYQAKQPSRGRRNSIATAIELSVTTKEQYLFTPRQIFVVL